MKLSKHLLAYLFLLLTIAINAQNVTKKTFEVDELKSDVEFYFSELEKTHPNLYYYYPKDSVLQAKETIIRQLLPMSRNDFAKLIELNSNRFFDGHTGLKWYFGWGGMLTEVTIPDTAFLFPPKKIRVERGALYTEESISKILSINGRESGEIVATMRNILEAGKHNYIKDCTIEDNFSTYYYLLFGSSQQFNLTIEHDRKITQVEWQGVAKKDVYKENNTVPHFDLIIRNDIALLTVNTFDGKLFDEFQAFLDSSIKEIKKANVKYLFIDVSENGGGSDDNVSLLLDYIYPADYYFLYGYATQGGETSGGEWERQNKIDSPYLGKLFILQSYKTFSAGMDFSSAIKTSNRGIVIGEMTGDPAYSFSNIQKRNIMPNTKMDFVSASGFYAMPSGSHNCNLGILPDVYCHRKDLNALKKDKNSLFEYFETIIAKYGDRQNAIEILKIFE
jgi:hypothetical protein